MPAMGVRFLEHFTILTDDPEATRDWWCAALGLREGAHPDFGFPVFWLYIGDRDVVHIGKARFSEHQQRYLATPDGNGGASDGAPGTGRLDHVCFNCEGIEEFVGRLERSGVAFSERQAHGQALHQLFFLEPINAIKIELNFSADEARRAGRKPSLTAQGGAS
jgi:catechol 2,3-dioxygenase-like lactoylglutathione lyase family enzyme